MEDYITVEDVSLSKLFGDEDDLMDTTDAGGAPLQTPRVEQGNQEVEIILPSGKPIEPEVPSVSGNSVSAQHPPAKPVVKPTVKPVAKPVVKPMVKPVVKAIGPASGVVTLQSPEFFRLREDCSNVPPVGSDIPKAVLYKSHNITDPTRVKLALSFARNYRRIPASVLGGDAKTLGQLAQKVRESLKTPELSPEKTAPGPSSPNAQGVKKKPRRRPQKKPKAPKTLTVDERLIARNRALDGQVQREKAVNHQAHTEINRLNRELGKEKAENARLNADLIRIRGERDSLKEQLASGKKHTYSIWPRSESLILRSNFQEAKCRAKGENS